MRCSFSFFVKESAFLLNQYVYWLEESQVDAKSGFFTVSGIDFNNSIRMHELLENFVKGAKITDAGRR